VQVVKAEEQRKDRVFFGAWVTIEDEEGDEQIYQIVGVDEVEVSRGRISWKSPVGRALLGKRVDDEVSVRWHAGERELIVVGIAYEPPASIPPIKASMKARMASEAGAGANEDDEDDRDDEEDEDLDEDDAATTAKPPAAAKPAPAKKSAPPARPRATAKPRAKSGIKPKKR
jgi:hypothetical protein